MLSAHFKKRKVVRIIFVTIALAAIFPACRKDHGEDAVLASIGGKNVSREDFEKRLLKFTMLTPIDEPHVRDALLQNMIDEKVLLLEAEARGETAKPEFLEYRERALVDEMLDKYKDMVADTQGVVREQEILAAFALKQEQARARHLHAATREQAQTLYNRLLRGESFEQLAAEVFRDPKLAKNGGDLGYFAWDEMDQMFSAAARKLEVGEISQPIQTRYGYSIIRLEDRFRNPFLLESEFAKQKKKLQWQERHRVRADMLRAHGRNILTGLNMHYHQDNLDLLWRRFEFSRKDSSRTFAPESGDEPDKIDDLPLADFGDETWTIAVFQQKARWTSRRQQEAIRTKDALVEFVNGLILRETLIREAKEKMLDQHPEVLAAVEARAEGFLIRKMQRMVMDSVRVPEDSIRAEYDLNPKQYVHPRMVNVREITVASREKADWLMAQFEKGADFAELARKHSMREWTRKRGGEMGFSRKGDFGIHGEAIFKLSLNEVGEPYKIGETFTIVKMIAIQPERLKNYKEARPEIAESLIFYTRMRRLKKQTERWRGNYPVSFDEVKLNAIRSPLRQTAGGS